MSTVLVPTDGSPPAEQAIGHAVTIANKFDGTVHGLYAVHLTPNANYDLGIESPTVHGAEEDRGAAALDTIERQCERGGVDFERHLRDGAPDELIPAVAQEIGADVIVMGTHGGGGVARPLLGSTTIGVLRQGTHPVLAVPRDAAAPDHGYDKLLVGTDASEGARVAEGMAIEWADAFEASIHGLYVVEVALSDSAEIEEALQMDGEKAVADLEERAEEAGVDITTAVEMGSPHEVIHEQADEQDADMIVIGARGRGGIERTFLGSVSERTIRTATKPVLVV
jgi:nucleotide-binding universal stress UspA family protein